jgi:hypothetical protein
MKKYYLYLSLPWLYQRQSANVRSCKMDNQNREEIREYLRSVFDATKKDWHMYLQPRRME